MTVTISISDNLKYGKFFAFVQEKTVMCCALCTEIPYREVYCVLY